ncbi:Oidioi.mRNA.OKI2018_I69.chr1.g1597.t1.cds [Oikopleura dioica]|uniref:Oidioi.mRNA.OKI2018_I69.chr1.g1597.t1.cds n=1 Tax=Oikopleura dioica TaxID=34765 RepID=A0ABN7SVF0_OIKDI|nr:Oidioi.mRNA.OKI2018_I69.chr1.g1597.t1.cds [Oikopleura dioica]
MKLLSAVISSALAAREPDAERRLEKITARATELNAFVQSYPRSTQKQKDGVEKWVGRVLEDLNNIDTSKCPPPAEEDKFADEIETIDNLCEDSLKVASMIRSYARTFGVSIRSHKLKNVARRAGRCDTSIATTEPAPTEEPTTLAPVKSVCGKNRHAKCRSLGNSEIFFENEWTCRNCFRIRAYYGTGGGFNFDPSKGDFVSIKFTEPVFFQKWNHPLTEPAEIAGSNKHHWKMNFKNDGNFVSGMIAPLKNSGGGNFMVNHYPTCTPGKWNKYQIEQQYTDAKDTLELTMSIDDEVVLTRIVDVDDVYSGDLFVDVSNDFHDSATGFKGNTQFDEVEYFVDCEDNSWTNIAVKQTQVDFGRLELTVFQDGNALGSNIIHHTDAFVGPVEVWSGNSWFEPASFFKIKNFIHSSRPYEPESCDETIDPCEGLENCETFQDSCLVAPFRGNRLGESNGHLGFKISAEVQCTDRVAPSWENVLHVHTGTNRENFGDRYFTIWKEANKPDGIRIVAPAFENANHELNAYVSCLPGWHTFTVQQTESGKNHMLLEILMDGSVVASQEVRKTETYQGPLFVEASNAFVWPAAYDHLVRNFYHQAIFHGDPCFDKENCTTFIDASSISPSENNQIATVTAAVNHKTSVEILCNHDMPIAGVHYQLLHMTKDDGTRTLGDRFFSFWRRHTSQEILINYASPIGNQWGETGRFWDCVPGEWNTYTLEQRQDIDKPFMTTSTVYIDGVNVHSVRAETSEILKDVPIKVFLSKGLPAAAFQIRNFFYQTFAELPYEEPTAAPCSDGRENCFEFVGSVPVVPELNLRKATITAHANNEISVDIKCGTMNDNVHNSIVEITSGAARGVLGERVFMIWEAPIGRPGKLLINVADPTGVKNDTGFWFDCNDGDWNTYKLSQRQNAGDPALTDIVFTIDGVTKHTRQVPTADVFRNDDIKVYAGRWHPAINYEIRNFSYQFFDDIPLGPQNCNDVDNCVIVGVDSVSPVQGNLAATITAVKNYKFSIDIKCDHSLPFNGFKNIFHVTTGPNDGVYGSRQFAIWRSSNENKMHITWANPKAAAGYSRNYFHCNDGEWNTYTFEQWQQAPNQPQWIWHKLSIDGVKIDAKRFNDNDYPVLDGEQMNVWISNEAADAASTFEIRIFSYEKYPDV